MKIKTGIELEKSEIVEQIPVACSNELAAVEFMEAQRWGNSPCCAHCESKNVYKMTDAKTGERSKRFLWRCHDCKKQYTVRIGTVYEESRIPLRHWCYAFWRASTSKKGVSALEIKRQTQVSYKSALFMMHRIRWAMRPSQPPKFKGTIEADETYVGGKGYNKHADKRGRNPDSKSPVFAIVQRDGDIHRRVVANVTSDTLRGAILECVDRSSRIVTDDFRSYWGLEHAFQGGHAIIRHSEGQYVIGDVTTNTVESSFALMKRGLTGIYHAVSKKHLHRYLAEYDFRWNTRRMNDGERTVAAIRSAEGKRLMYREPSQLAA